MKTYNVLQITTSDIEDIDTFQEVEYTEIVKQNCSKKEANKFLNEVEQKIKEYEFICSQYSKIGWRLMNVEDKLNFMYNDCLRSDECDIIEDEYIEQMMLTKKDQKVNLYNLNKYFEGKLNSLKGEYLIIPSYYKKLL